MSEKVKLPREIVEALDATKYMGWHNIIESTVNMGEISTSDLIEIRDHFRTDWSILARAYVYGYEVEETPEEKVKALYDRYSMSDDRKYRGMAIGIKETVDALNIKIEGVNA